MPEYKVPYTHVDIIVERDKAFTTATVYYVMESCYEHLPNRLYIGEGEACRGPQDKENPHVATNLAVARAMKQLARQLYKDSIEESHIVEEVEEIKPAKKMSQKEKDCLANSPEAIKKRVERLHRKGLRLSSHVVESLSDK